METIYKKYISLTSTEEREDFLAKLDQNSFIELKKEFSTMAKGGLDNMRNEGLKRL